MMTSGQCHFDTEFETFVMQVRNLIIPIMEAVRKYGLNTDTAKNLRQE